MIVVDASALIEWLLQSPTGARVEERLFSGALTLHAPHLVDLEVAQVLRRCVAGGIIPTEEAQGALRDFLDLPILRHPHDPLLWRIWELRGSLAAYDAAYVALAEALGATLLTCDAKLAGALGHSASVEVV